jgi:hypothetical protein
MCELFCSHGFNVKKGCFGQNIYISSVESGARITTDCLITHFYTDALESIPRSTKFDEDINLAMFLRVSV